MNKDKFIGWLTTIVIILYVGTTCFSFWRSSMSWQDFSATVGPISGLLLGYWIKGEK